MHTMFTIPMFDWLFENSCNAFRYGFAGAFSSRERPFLAVDPRDGAPVFLLTAVSPLAPVGNRAAKGKDWTWTLSQLVGVQPNGAK